MNDQLQKALAAILAKATQGVETGAAFLQAELPEVVRQLLMWEAISSAISFCFGVAMIVAAVLILKRLIRVMKSNPRTDWDDYPGYIIPSILLSAFGLMWAACSLTWLKILVAPKLFLIEYAAHLVK